MKVPKSNKVDTKTLGFGGNAGIRLITKFFARVMPKLQKTKSPKEGLRVLLKQIEDDVLMTSGLKSGELGYKVLEEIKRNTKVEYQNNKVCVTYRNIKKCMKLDKK